MSKEFLAIISLAFVFLIEITTIAIIGRNQANKYCYDYIIDGVTYHNVEKVYIHPDHGRISFTQEGIKYNIPYTTYEKTKHPKDSKLE